MRRCRAAAPRGGAERRRREAAQRGGAERRRRDPQRGGPESSCRKSATDKALYLEGVYSLAACANGRAALVPGRLSAQEQAACKPRAGRMQAKSRPRARRSDGAAATCLPHVVSRLQLGARSWHHGRVLGRPPAGSRLRPRPTRVAVRCGHGRMLGSALD